jgi:class 3 adenylate cyclase/streptogramin lyase
MQRPRRESVLTTVLFTDIVGSSEVAAEMGDRRWRVLLSRHHALVRRQLRRFGGKELDTAGDGFFASFENPGNAIRCAASVVEGVQELGIDVRTGLHLGQAEILGKKLGGAAVHIGARTMAQAGPAEVLVTSGLKDVLHSSDFTFEDRGSHVLKGVPGEWRLFRLSSLDRPLPLPLEPSVAAERRAAVQAPPIWRRRYVPIGIAAAVMLGGVVAGILLVMREEPSTPALTGVPAHAPLRLDPRTGKVRAVVPIGDPWPVPRLAPGNPCAVSPPARSISAGEGSVWVTNGGSDSVLRFDAHSGRRRSIRVLQRPVAVTVGRSGVWVASTEGGLTRIDPGTEETRNIDISASAPAPMDVAVDDQGSVYVTAFACTFSVQDTPLVRVSGSGGSISLLPLPHHLANAEGFSVITLDGFVWVTAGLEVWKVDSGTGKVLKRVQFQQTLGELAGDEDSSSVWLTTVGSGGQVGWAYQIDASTAEVTNQYPIGCCPGTIAIGAGYVWVTNLRDGTIQRISKTTGDVAAPITVGRGVNGIAVGQGGVWVTIDR